ncbi:glycoside hydrolase family 79 protein [Diplodia corticola]|uniref:Glycoside hydrolase family 79 protein n=1 Tax=Diplodia corticola TaxID=236234 RepID=A0A1J9QQY9_9PEZI|nr:glycoside hydrolase family 79 protein [Diplodia corticola]OJD30434.1 glycoside hydrolase family 79 protein [Diplodia corticola]
MKPTSNLVMLCAAMTSAAAASDDASTSTIQFSPKLTADDATTVRKSYIGFGIEMKSFPDYAGRDSSPNAFSAFLLNQIFKETGGAPLHIRVGGTSMDNMRYNPALTSKAVDVTGDLDACRLHTYADLGTPWLRSFQNLAPALAPQFTVQVPLARKDVDNGVKFAGACIDALTPGGGGKKRDAADDDDDDDGQARRLSARLDAFEIGNEPNLYPNSPGSGCRPKPDRSGAWGPSDYVDEWTNYAGTLANRVGALKNSGAKSWFQTLTLSSHVDHPDQWGLSAIGKGLNNGGYVRTVSQHYYQADATKDLKGELLTHNTTVSRMQENFGANIAFAKKNNIPFILGEVGSAIGGDGDATNPDLYDTLGAALWTLDFLLHGMSFGIRRVSMQLGTDFRISAWQPFDTKNHPMAVHGNYYGLIAGASFVGGDGNLQIRPLDAVDGHPNIVGYAGYHGGKLSKIAVLNLQVWDGGAGDRPAKDISLAKLGGDTTADSGITWAGRRWTAENNGKEYADGENPVIIGVQNGVPARNIVVKASEAVMVEILRG